MLITSGLVTDKLVEIKIFKKKIVISTINMYEGGALSILQECLNYLGNAMTLHFKEPY